jgi:hypothetical protein
MTRLQLTAALTATALTASVAPATAAPTVQADHPCYTPGEDMTFTGTGYTPGGNVDLALSLTGKHGSNLLFPKQPAIADPAGGFRQVLTAPDLASSDDTQEEVSVTANDRTRLEAGPPTPDAFAPTETLLSTWDVYVDPWDAHQVDPRKKVKFKVFGFEPATRVFAHYVLNGKRVKTVFVGNLTGPCGDLTASLREFPFRPVPAGSYDVYFEGSRVFDKTQPWLRYRHVRVTKDKAVP